MNIFKNKYFNISSEAPLHSDGAPEKDADGNTIIYVCKGRMCGRTAPLIMHRLKQVAEKGYKIVPKECTCMGLCSRGANMRICGKVYSRNTPITASKIVKDL